MHLAPPLRQFRVINVEAERRSLSASKAAATPFALPYLRQSGRSISAVTISGIHDLERAWVNVL